VYLACADVAQDMGHSRSAVLAAFGLPAQLLSNGLGADPGARTERKLLCLAYWQFGPEAHLRH